MTTQKHQLTVYQKLTLATTIFVVYWPIRLYVNIDSVSWSFLQSRWSFLLLEIVITIPFFILWLTVTEWFQDRFFNRLDKGFLVDFSWLTQLITFLAAGALAVFFNLVVFKGLWELMATELQVNTSKISRPKSTTTLVEAKRRVKVFNGLTVMALLSAFYLAANRRGYNYLEGVQLRAEQVKKEAIQTQFTALKNQVNPHFLFNNLSILASLVEVNPTLSLEFINQLAKTYRFILEQHESDSIKLADEVGFMNAYTFLLQIRFRGKLVIELVISKEQAQLYRIAPLTLQLLIENAVKHNHMSVEEPLRVSIQIVNDYLLVSNPIRLRSQMEESTQVGLKNIQERYRLLTDRPVRIGHLGGLFVVEIPLIP